MLFMYTYIHTLYMYFCCFISCYTYSIFLLLLSLPAVADTGLQKQFLGNKTVIMAVNIRTFNAKDKNGNEIIDSGEESGNFINAIERLDEIKSHGINVLHLLPVTPVGKLKAL